jgi:tripartite-type tricarboxylate transporter receptor subunit TctC
MPGKTPTPFLQKVSLDASEILSERAVKARYEQLGVLCGGSSPAELGARGRSEAKLWRSVMQTAGIKPE